MTILKPLCLLLVLLLSDATSYAQTSCADLLLNQDKARKTASYRTPVKGDLFSSKAMVSVSRNFSKRTDSMVFSAGATGALESTDTAFHNEGLYLLFGNGSSYRNDSALVRTGYGASIGTIVSVSVGVDSALFTLLKEAPIVRVVIGSYTGEPDKWTAEALPTMLSCLVAVERPDTLD